MLLGETCSDPEVSNRVSTLVLGHRVLMRTFVTCSDQLEISYGDPRGCNLEISEMGWVHGCECMCGHQLWFPMSPWQHSGKRSWAIKSLSSLTPAWAGSQLDYITITDRAHWAGWIILLSVLYIAPFWGEDEELIISSKSKGNATNQNLGAVTCWWKRL